MKNDIIQLKGENAKVIAEVTVSMVARTISVRVCQLIPSGIFVVLRNDFMQGQFAEKDAAVQLFLSIVEDEAF